MRLKIIRWHSTRNHGTHPRSKLAAGLQSAKSGVLFVSRKPLFGVGFTFVDGVVVGIVGLSVLFLKLLEGFCVLGLLLFSSLSFCAAGLAVSGSTAGRTGGTPGG